MQIYACTRMLGKRTYYSFISNSLCSGGNAPMKSFMAWEYNMTKPTAYFEQNMVISQYQKHMGMGQNLLVSILMGWTSIYQLFCGSLGTRVMTHSHIFRTIFCNMGRSSYYTQNRKGVKPNHPNNLGIFGHHHHHWDRHWDKKEQVKNI